MSHWQATRSWLRSWAIGPPVDLDITSLPLVPTNLQITPEFKRKKYIYIDKRLISQLLSFKSIYYINICFFLIQFILYIIEHVILIIYALLIYTEKKRKLIYFSKEKKRKKQKQDALMLFPFQFPWQMGHPDAFMLIIDLYDIFWTFIRRPINCNKIPHEYITCRCSWSHTRPAGRQFILTWAWVAFPPTILTSFRAYYYCPSCKHFHRGMLPMLKLVRIS